MSLIGELRKRRLALLAVLVTCVVAPIALLPYRGDDTINRAWATVSWGDAIRQAWDLQSAWITVQGRFFPGSSLYGLVLWRTFDSRIAYQTFVAVLCFACIGLAGFIVRRVTRSADVAVITVVGLAACTEIRWWSYDGLSSFSGLVPWTLLLTLAAGAGAAAVLRTGHRRWAVLVAVAWALAVTGYEVSLLMLPAVVLLLVVAFPGASRRRWAWALGPLVIVGAAQFILSLVLHARATGLAPAYMLTPDGPVGTTFLKQFTAALPSSQYWLGGVPDGVALDWGLVVLLVACIAAPVFVAWGVHASFNAVAVPRRIAVALLGAGAWAWVVPSLLAALTFRWQQELIPGQGYIYLPYEYVGVALVVAGGVALLAGPDRPRWMRLTATGVFALLLVGAAVAIASNIAFASSLVPGPANAFS
jgi:hypothetical protein